MGYLRFPPIHQHQLQNTFASAQRSDPRVVTRIDRHAYLRAQLDYVKLQTFKLNIFPFNIRNPKILKSVYNYLFIVIGILII